jgi:peptidoglycan/xylan/chitin deacetylase (PgdA/CDA1 family)
MYHALDPGDGRLELLDAAERAYTLPAERFFEHLHVFARGPRTVLSPEALLAETEHKTGGAGGRSGPGLFLSFDDGNSSDHDIALPALIETGWRAFFFITTDRIGQKGSMDAEQIRDLRRAGMTLGAHGRSHRLLDGLSPADQKEELEGGRKALEDILGEAVKCLSLPGGRMNRATPRIAGECGYEWVFTSRPEPPLATGRPRLCGRVAVRPGWTAERLEDFLQNQGARMAALRRADRAKRLVQALLGNALYARLHRAVWSRLD